MHLGYKLWTKINILLLSRVWWGEDPSAAQAEGKSHRAEQESKQEGTGGTRGQAAVVSETGTRQAGQGQTRSATGDQTRGRRRKAAGTSRTETKQAGQGQTRSVTGDQSGGNRWKIRHSTRQSGPDAETGAGLNAARLSQVWRLGLMRRRG